MQACDVGKYSKSTEEHQAAAFSVWFGLYWWGYCGFWCNAVGSGEVQQYKVTLMQRKLNGVPYPCPVAGTWEQVITGLLYKLHAFTNLGLCDLEFSILL